MGVSPNDLTYLAAKRELRGRMFVLCLVALGTIGVTYLAGWLLSFPQEAVRWYFVMTLLWCLPMFGLGVFLTHAAFWWWHQARSEFFRRYSK